MALEQAQSEIVANLMAWGQVEPRRMFGCDAYLVRGKMFAFFQDEGVVVKVPSPQRERLLEDTRVSPFVHQGRRFGDWLHLRLSDPQDVSLALPAIEESYRYVQASPARGRRPRR
ncbi:MAG: TfoX/Sxy family protein [Dehalococcoidia bacterium]|nr:MAG: TfoX/Sxy family protein [Dehalococcoidia bacterium]